MAKIFIITEGGGKIGMGHISRCLSLYEAFAERGYSSTLIINCDINISDILDGYKYIILDWIKKKGKLLSMVGNSDIIIIDSYLCPISFYQKLISSTSTIAYIDDNIKMDYQKGIVINGVMCSQNLKYPKKDGVTYLLGHEYAFLRKDFWEVPEKIINREIQSVMITCGGNDSNGLSYRILKAISDIYPDLDIKLVLNRMDTPYLDYFKDKSTILMDLSALQMRELMIESDLVITASGQTTYELARTGTPFIAITTAQNQLYSITCFYKNGLVGEPISSDDSELEKLILLQFSKLANQDARLAIHKKMKQVFTGIGSLKVIDFLLSTFIKNKT
jgi:UDP-2,4-diacetamido-2,4,6-trideoxy-beta-L-altropyranose hydrolase